MDTGQEPVTRPKFRARQMFNLFLIVTQIFFFGSLYHFAQLYFQKDVVILFSTLDGSKEHFVNTLRPFTNMLQSSRSMATSNYLNATDTTQAELILLKSFIKDYLSFHATKRQGASRRLIFQPQRAGMGDVFGTFCFAYWAAVISKRVFLVDWNEPFPLEGLLQTVPTNTDMFFRNATDGPYLGASSKQNVIIAEKGNTDQYISLLESNVTSVVYASRLVMSREGQERFVRRNYISTSLESAVINLHHNYNFRRALLHHVFRMSQSISQRHKNTAHAMGFRMGHMENPGMGWLGGQKRPYVAVHARIGRGVRERGSRFAAVSDNMLIPARCLASRAVRIAFIAGSPALPVFLATDTPEFRPMFKNVVDKISHGRVQVVNGDWDVAHSSQDRFHSQVNNLKKMNEEVKKKNEEDAGRDEAKAQENVRFLGGYMDLIMLGHAEHIVSLYSSFPRLALALGDAETLTELRNEICLKVELW